MAVLRSAAEITVLFAAGLLMGALLQHVGLLPGDLSRVLRGYLSAWSQPAAPAPRAATGAGLTAPQIDAPLPSLPLRGAMPGRDAESVPAMAPARTAPAVVRLLGDGDPVRDTLRRAVITTARAALTAPCDLDRRVAFQISLRDYARAWANAPRLVDGRLPFRTPLDGEAVRAARTAVAAGLIEPELVERWRALERTGLAEIAGEPPATPLACPSGPRHQA